MAAWVLACVHLAQLMHVLRDSRAGLRKYSEALVLIQRLSFVISGEAIFEVLSTGSNPLCT